MLAPAAQAVQGGEPADGDQRVVALVFGTNTRASCSGSPINPYIVVAAAHCMSNPNFTYTSESYAPNGLSIGAPGADLTKDSIAARPHVLQVAITPGYNEKSAADDIAFYFLDKPIVQTPALALGNLDEIAELKASAGKVTHIGYGYIAPNNVEDFRPHKITLPTNPQSSMRFGFIVPPEVTTISTDETKGFALCKHDSGGPFVATIDGVEKILAINLLADGCDRNGANTVITGTLGLAVYPYLELLQRQWSAFKASHASLSGIDAADSQLQGWIKDGAPKPKPTPTPSVSASASPTPISSPPLKASVVITCIKGKISKKVTGIQPKCPAGFKAK